jgi:chromate reductase, NAD(P)H dehydrogenase (quinone)
MAKIHDVAMLIGSLRKDSINQVADALAPLAPDDVRLSIVEIGHLPIYSQDDDEHPPRGMDVVPRTGKGSRRGSLRHVRA